VSGPVGYNYTNVSASAVITPNMGAILHGVILNSVAATATIQFYDFNSTTNPVNAITGLWTPGAIVIPTAVSMLDLMGRASPGGIVVIIATAAANITVVWS